MRDQRAGRFHVGGAGFFVASFCCCHFSCWRSLNCVCGSLVTVITRIFSRASRLMARISWFKTNNSVFVFFPKAWHAVPDHCASPRTKVRERFAFLFLVNRRPWVIPP